MINRRGFLVGLSALIAAPAIVRTGLIMPVNAKLILPTQIIPGTFPIEGRAWTTSVIGGWKLAFEDFGADANEAWLRHKKRNAAQFAQIWDQYGNPLPERTDG